MRGPLCRPRRRCTSSCAGRSSSSAATRACCRARTCRSRCTSRAPARRRRRPSAGAGAAAAAAAGGPPQQVAAAAANPRSPLAQGAGAGGAGALRQGDLVPMGPVRPRPRAMSWRRCASHRAPMPAAGSATPRPQGACLRAHRRPCTCPGLPGRAVVLMRRALARAAGTIPTQQRPRGAGGCRRCFLARRCYCASLSPTDLYDTSEPDDAHA